MNPDLEWRVADPAEAVIGYILERYGDDGVIDFLHAPGRAALLPTAIERGLDVTYSEFYSAWLTWFGPRTQEWNKSLCHSISWSFAPTQGDQR